MKYFFVSSYLLILLFCNIFSNAQETELLSNPDFNDGINSWWAYGATITTSDGEVMFDISDQGVNTWDIQLGQGSLTLHKGYKYTLCWRAKREFGTLTFNVGLGEAPYTLYFSDIPVDFDGTWQEHCVEYVHNGEDISNVSVTLNMGGSNANATIDYVYLLEDPNNEVTITFQVDMQFESVSPDGVYLAGSFNDWDTPVVLQQNNNIFSASLVLKKGDNIDYRFINGNIWENINGECATVDDNNRSIIVPEESETLGLVCFNSCTYCIDPILFSANPGAGPVSFYGKMQVNGNRIYGERTGTPVQVKGISLYWSIWDGEKFWNSGTVNTLVDEWDIELIRAPMAVDENNGWDYGYLHENGREKQIAFMETIIETAIARDIYVIVDYHSHYADRHTDAAIEFFSNMAEKYGGFDHVIFEIYNEPIEPDWPTIKTYAEQVIEAIRIYSDNLVIVGTEYYSSGIDNASLLPLDDPNTAYVFHFYADHQDELRSKVQTALNNGSALFASEWGNIHVAGENEGHTDEESFENSDAWHEFMDENYISSANWCVYIDDFENASGLFYDENGFNGDVSFNGENWTDQSIISPSGMYVYTMLKQQAETAPWRLADQEVYSIEYHLNGGINGANPTLFPVNLDKDIVLDEPIKENYLFAGWYNNSEFAGDTVNKISTGSTGNIELYAKWTESTVIELLKNPDFRSGTYNWVHWGENDSVAVENGQIIIRELTDNSGQLWTYSFYNSASFALKEGYRYTLNWRARRESGKIHFEAATYDPLTIYFSDTPEFNGEWQEGTVSYDHTTETVYDLSFTVFVGGYTSDVSFDYISLTESEIAQYAVSIKVEPEVGGNVTGAGTYEDGKAVTLTATANEGYKFVNWTKNGIEVSTNTTYTFSASEDAEYIANFDTVPTYSITIAVNPPKGGSATGAGIYDEGELVTLSAIPNTGYEFVNWTMAENEVSTNSTFNLTASKDVSYTANFNPFTGLVEITFRVDMQNETVSSNVFLCGSFNDWDSADPLEKEGTVYSKILELIPGETVEYKFVNGEQWEETIPDECGTGVYNNRYFIVPDNNNALEVVCFNSCETCQTLVFELNGQTVSVFPNPVDDILEIDGLCSSSEYSLKWFNVSGQCFKQETLSGKTHYYLHTEDLPSGIYTLIIENNLQRETVKIIK